MNFSEKLKEIRSNEGLSQEQLAERIGVSRQAITKWENGKGLPDIENMMIIAEIFKTTIDELLTDSVARQAEQKAETAALSETIFDIDCKKHFDLNIGSAAKIILSSAADEKMHVRLLSETLMDIDKSFKVKLDEKRNKLDVTCVNRNKLSRFEAQEALTVEILLPEKYADHCEVEASVRLLVLENLHLRRLEYDGDASRVQLLRSSGSFEFTAKTDYDISVDEVTGRVDVYQWKAKSLVHIPKRQMGKVVNKGRKCSIVYCENGSRVEKDAAPNENADGSKLELSISGMFSELIVDQL